MASRSEWLDAFLAYDFDESYFNNIDYDDAGHDTDDDDWWGSECDSEDEAEFEFVNPLVGEMFAYMQRHYDKQPMHDSILTGQGYMDELNSDPNKCFEMSWSVMDTWWKGRVMWMPRRWSPCCYTYLATISEWDVLQIGSSTQLRWCPATSTGCYGLFTRMRDIWLSLSQIQM